MNCKNYFIFALTSALAMLLCVCTSVPDNCGVDGFPSVNSNTEFCFNGQPLTRCGDENKGEYDPAKEFCDDNKIYNKCGNMTYFPSTHFCGGDLILEKCGGLPFDPEIQYCANGTVTEKCPEGDLNPDGSCTINGLDKFFVTVLSDGIGSTGSGNYPQGSIVTIVAGSAPDGQIFLNWTTTNTDVAFEDDSSSTTTFVMPNDDVTVSANFGDIPPIIPTYSVTVVSIGDGASGGGEYYEGDTVWIVSGTAPDGYTFTRWTSEDVTFISNAERINNQFIMPAHDVTVTANFVKPHFNPNVVYGSFVDTRDDQLYYTVEMPDRNVWMAENLNYGTPTGSTCYDNLSSNCNTYGRLYDWATAKVVCPDGWRLPTDDEWTTLVDSLGDPSTAGTKLKSSIGWTGSDISAGTDDFGFSAMPGGYYRSDNQIFDNDGRNGYWWSATESSSGAEAWRRGMRYNYEDVTRAANNKSDMFSVRCVKNKD